MKKESLNADAWMKDVAPSTELRKWFDHRVERWEKFRHRYRDELAAKPGAWEPILDEARRGTVTCSTALVTLFTTALWCYANIWQSEPPECLRVRRRALLPRTR
jgi:hypothetical protein